MKPAVIKPAPSLPAAPTQLVLRELTVSEQVTVVAARVSVWAI